MVGGCKAVSSLLLVSKRILGCLMFERYDEQACDRKQLVLCALATLALSVGFVFYEAWVIGSMFGIFTLVFGIPPFFFGKERFEKTMDVLSWIGTFG